MGVAAGGLPGAPIVAQDVAVGEGILVRRTLRGQAAGCAGLIVHGPVGTGGGGEEVVAVRRFGGEAVGGQGAVGAAAGFAGGLFRAGGGAAGAAIGLNARRAAAYSTLAGVGTAAGGCPGAPCVGTLGGRYHIAALAHHRCGAVAIVLAAVADDGIGLGAAVMEARVIVPGFIIQPAAGEIVLLCRCYLRRTILAGYRSGAVAVVVVGGVAAVDRYGQLGFVAGLVGHDDGLHACGRGEQELAAAVQKHGVGVDRDRIHIFLGDGDGLGLAVDLAVLHTADDGTYGVQNDPVGADIRNQVGAVSKSRIDDIRIVGGDGKGVGIIGKGPGLEVGCGEILLAEQIRDADGIAAVIACGDGHVLLAVKEQAEGDVMEEAAPLVLADLDLAGGRLGIPPPGCQGDACHAVLIGKAGVGGIGRNGHAAARPAVEGPATLPGGRDCAAQHRIEPAHTDFIGHGCAAGGVEADSVVLGRPDGIEGDGLIDFIDGVQRIGNLAAVQGCPAGLGIAGPGEQGTAEGQRRIDHLAVSDGSARAVCPGLIGDVVGDHDQLQLAGSVVVGYAVGEVRGEIAGIVHAVGVAEHGRGLDAGLTRRTDPQLRPVRQVIDVEDAAEQVEVAGAAGGGVAGDNGRTADMQAAGGAGIKIHAAADIGGVIPD